MRDISIFPFIKNFNESESEFFRENIRYVEIPKNTILFYQGDICSDILLLKEGRVRLYAQGEGVQEITFYILKPSEQCIINTSSLVSQTKAIGTAITVSNIKGYLINEKSVKTLMKKSESYQNFMFSLFTIRLNTLANIIEDIKFKQLDKRLIELIEKQSSSEINMTHQDIASHLGTSRVVISRLLKKLEQNGIIKLQRGSIIYLK